MGLDSGSLLERGEGVIIENFTSNVDRRANDSRFFDLSSWAFLSLWMNLYTISELSANFLGFWTVSCSHLIYMVKPLLRFPVIIKCRLSLS
jgi:hypothetical protein